MIRFPLISSEEIVEQVVTSGVLTSDELVNLFSYICANPSKKPNIIYPCKPRVVRYLSFTITHIIFWSKIIFEISIKI